MEKLLKTLAIVRYAQVYSPNEIFAHAFQRILIIFSFLILEDLPCLWNKLFILSRLLDV